MKLLLLAALLAGPFYTPDPPRTVLTTSDVYVKVGWHGQTMERCKIDLLVDGAVVGHADTLEDGRARFDGLTSERCELAIKREGYFNRRVVIYNFSRRDLHEEIDLKKRVPWQLSGTVRGKHALIKDAKVKLLEGGDTVQDTASGADGIFRFQPLFDTECRFTVEAPGFHRQLVWMANRTQSDLIADVDLWPATGGAGAPWMRGEPEANVELRFWKRPARRIEAGAALGALFDVSRIFPADDRPAGALSGARLDLPDTGRPTPALARTERALTRLVVPYPRRKEPTRRRR